MKKNQIINLITKKKRPIIQIITTLFIISSLLIMDISPYLISAENNDNYTFFYDDFMFTTVNSTAIWGGTRDIENGKLVVQEGRKAYAICSLDLWNGYTDLILKVAISLGQTSPSARIVVRDANTSEILFSDHPSNIHSVEINLLPFVDLTSTHLKLEIHGYVKFDIIKIYTPNLFLYNLLLDDNVEDVLVNEVSESSYLEDGQQALFRPYSRYVSFNPEAGRGSYLMETEDYFIPYFNDICLVGQIARMSFEIEDESAFDSTVRFVIEAKFYHGRAVEYKILADITERLDGYSTPIYIPLDSLKGQDVSFLIHIFPQLSLDSPLPYMAISYLGITAQASPKINGREFDAIDYSTKDVYTQITPATVNGEENLVLARDREGTIATYRTFIGTNYSHLSCDGFVLSEYLDESVSGAWSPDESGESLTFDLFEAKKGVITVQSDKFVFTTGTLEAYFSVFEYGVATGFIYKYEGSNEFWTIAVQKIEESRDLALLIHNHAIVDTIPLIEDISSDVSVKIIKNLFLDSYHIYVNDQLTFVRSHGTASAKVGFYYRVIDNTDFGQYYPAQFHSIDLFSVGKYDITRMYLTVQNPMKQETRIKVKESYSDESLYIREREIAEFLIPHTDGFETFVVHCIVPSIHNRITLELDTDVLVYVYQLGFLSYSSFGETRDACKYYKIAPSIIENDEGRRVFTEKIVIKDELEWVTYDMELQEGFFYIYADTTPDDNLEFEISIRPINASEYDLFTSIGTVYFLEKDSKTYGHHLFINSSTLENVPAELDIYEVKINVTSSDYPISVQSLATRSVSDKMAGDDYSNLLSDVEGWREEWDIDSSSYTYLDQTEWYTDVAFSALNGGPAENWFSPTIADYATNTFNDIFDFEEEDTEKFNGFYLSEGYTVNNGLLDVQLTDCTGTSCVMSIGANSDISLNTTKYYHFEITVRTNSDQNMRFYGIRANTDTGKTYGESSYILLHSELSTQRWFNQSWVTIKGDIPVEDRNIYQSIWLVFTPDDYGSESSINTTEHIYVEEVHFYSDDSLVSEENAFYTTLTSSENYIIERFLGNTIDVSVYPFLEMKIRSNNIETTTDVTIGVHTTSAGNGYASFDLTENWFYYRINLYQLFIQTYTTRYPDNDPSLITCFDIDKLLLSFEGEIDLSSIKIYSIAGWEYVPDVTDSIYSTAHLELEQETVFKLGTDSKLVYAVEVDEWSYYDGNYSYYLEFMITENQGKTVLLSLKDDNDNQFIDTIFVQDGNLYYEDWFEDIYSLNITVNTYRWYSFTLYSTEISDPSQHSYYISLDNNQTAEINYVDPSMNGNRIELNLTTTDSDLYLRRLTVSPFNISQTFSDGFEYKAQETILNIQWVLNNTVTSSNSYLTKINLADGGTIASSSSYLVIDENILLKYDLPDLEFLSPEDFYFWVTANVYADNLQIHINDDFILSKNENIGIEYFKDYRITTEDIGEYLSSISIVPLNDYAYIQFLTLWGNCTLFDYYTDFSDGNCTLDDWIGSSLPFITNTGDLSAQRSLGSSIDTFIHHYNMPFTDYVLTATVNSSSGIWSGDYCTVTTGLVFHSQNKNIERLNYFTGYYLKYIWIYEHPGIYESKQLQLWNYATSMDDILIESWSIPYNDINYKKAESSFGISVTYVNESFFIIEPFVDEIVVGREIIEDSSRIYSSGYTGICYDMLTSDTHLPKGVINSFSVFHKYYYPTSERLILGVNDKDNAFIVGKLYIDEGIFQTETLDLSHQQTLTLTFKAKQWNTRMFIGLYQDSQQYGFKFYNGDVYKITNGGSTLLVNDWFKNNTFRTIYVTLVFGLDNDFNIFNMQLFTDKSFRPDIGDPLYISFNNTLSDSVFRISTLESLEFSYADIIVDSIECGGIYPVDIEFDDGSTTHTIRGSGEIAEYYLQASAQGSLKIDSTAEEAIMFRDFYVVEEYNTTLAFRYLSPGHHDELYQIIIYDQGEAYLQVGIVSTVDNKEEIMISVNNGQSMHILLLFEVPYYQWIDVSITISPLLTVTADISYQGVRESDSADITYYLEENCYHNVKIIKPSNITDLPLYLKNLRIYSGAGFSSDFGNGEITGWTLNTNSLFVHSTDVEDRPTELYVFAEPLGGWVDLTVSVDDGQYSLTTRLQVEDFETLRPYVVPLPWGFDTTTVHKYTIIANGILTLYSLSFLQTLLINDWLVVQPFDNVTNEIQDEFTQIGYLIEDFESDTFDYMEVVSDPEGFGNVGKVIGNEPFVLTAYDTERISDLSFYYKWDWDGVGEPKPGNIMLEFEVKNRDGDTREVTLIITPVISSHPSGIIFDYNVVTLHSDYDNMHAFFNYVPNSWQHVFITPNDFVLYAGIDTASSQIKTNKWQTYSVDCLTMKKTILEEEYYIDDISIYYEDENILAPFAKSYIRTQRLNQGNEGVWVPNQVNSLGFLDFSRISSDTSMAATEDASFVLECDKAAGAIIQITTTNPFLLFQGGEKIGQGVLTSPSEPMNYYIDVYLYEGINRFVIRSFHKGSGTFPWQIRTKIATTTNVRIVTSTYQAQDKDMLSTDGNYPISDWLVSDRPVNFGGLDYVGVGDDPYDRLEKDTGHYFSTRAFPYPGEQMNYTTIANGNEVTEWVGLNDFYNETGVMNYVESMMNKTSIETSDKIIYYTNLHFLQDIDDNILKIKVYYDPTSLIEAIYYDGQYVYGSLGEIGYTEVIEGIEKFYSDITITALDDGSWILNIPLSPNWNKFCYDLEEAAPVRHGYALEIGEMSTCDIPVTTNPIARGIHRLAIVLRAPGVLGSIPSNIFDIQANLTNFDDTMNAFTGITEYISTKQALPENGLMMQLDGKYRTIPSQGLMNGKKPYTGKKVLESQSFWDGIKYHSLRIVLIGVDQYGVYEDLNEDGVVNATDAVGLASYMVILDAGTKHEETSLVQHMIGPEGTGGTSSQPTKLCPRFSIISSSLGTNIFESSNIRLSHNSQTTDQEPFAITLQFSKDQFNSLEISSNRLNTAVPSEQELLDFISNTTDIIKVQFSLSTPIILSSDDSVLTLDSDEIVFNIGEHTFSYDRQLQKLRLYYTDKRDEEEISIQLATQVISHRDAYSIHKSYHKIGQVGGFAIYDINKIQQISEGTIVAPSHVSLGLFDYISNILKPVLGTKLTTVEGIESSIKAWKNGRTPPKYIVVPGPDRDIELPEPVDGNDPNHENPEEDLPPGTTEESFEGNTNGVAADVEIDPEQVLIDTIVTSLNGIASELQKDPLDISAGVISWALDLMDADPDEILDKLNDAQFNYLANACVWFSNLWNTIMNFFENLGKEIWEFMKMLAQIYIKIISIQAGIIMDLFRVFLLFIFSIIFGTNVGLHDTSELRYVSGGDYIFDEVTAQNFPHVYKLDHVIDVATGKTDLEGELTDEEIEERAKIDVQQGQGNDANPNSVKNVFLEIGIENSDEVTDLFFGKSKWVHSVEDGDEWDHYFGLRKHLSLFGLDLFSENTFILICEIVIGILPITAIIQDTKDSILEPMKFFRIFARIMIPLDITELFGNVLAQVFGGMKDWCAGTGLGKALGGIRDFIKNIFNRIGKFLKETLGPILKKFAKYGMILFIALLCLVTVVLIPMSGIVLLGLGTALLLVLGFVTFLVAAFKFLKTRIMKPIFDLAMGALKPVMDAIGNLIKKLFKSAKNAADIVGVTAVAKKTKVGFKALLTKTKDLILDIFGYIWQKITRLWEIGTWKPWKNKRMPWCIACYSNAAKKVLNTQFDVLRKADVKSRYMQILWERIGDLNWAKFNDMTPDEKYLVQEFARIIEPDIILDNIDHIDGAFKKGGLFFDDNGDVISNLDNNRWTKSVDAFASTWFDSTGNSMSKGIIFDYLKKLQKQIGENPDKTDFIDDFIKKTDDVDSLKALCMKPNLIDDLLMTGNEVNDDFVSIIKKHADDRLDALIDTNGNFAKTIGEEITTKEAESYARVLLFTAGIDEARSMDKSDFERFQKVWIVLHGETDEFRNPVKLIDPDNDYGIGEVAEDIIIGRRLATDGLYRTHGFDNFQLGKKNGKYVLVIMENKCNTMGLEYLPRRSTELKKEIYDQLMKLNVKEEFAKDIADQLVSAIDTTASGIGNNFLTKLKNGDLLDALVRSGEIDAFEINKIIEASIKQNQLIGLIENGRALQVLKIDDVWTVQKEFIDEIEFKFAKTSMDSCSITIPGDMFTPTLRNEGGKILFNIPQIPVPSTAGAEKEAVIYLNGLINEAMIGFTKTSEDLSSKTTTEICSIFTEMKNRIYKEFTNSEAFNDFDSVFEGGTMRFHLETLGIVGDESVQEQFKSLFDNRMSIGYDSNQHHTVPYGIRFKQYYYPNLLTDEEVSFIRRWFNNNLKKVDLSIAGNELEVKRIIEQALIDGDCSLTNTLVDSILKSSDPLFSVPTGSFFRDDNTVKAITFFDKSDWNLIKTEAGFTPNINFDLVNLLGTTSLEGLQKPIIFSVQNNVINGKFIKSPASRKYWINRLLDYGFAQNKIDALLNWLEGGGRGYGPNLLTANFDSDAWKMVLLLLLDHKNNWDDATRTIMHALQEGATNIDKWPGIPSWMRNWLKTNNFRFEKGAFWITDVNGLNIELRLGIAPFADHLGTSIALPGNNHWFNGLIDKIMEDAYKLFLSFPGDSANSNWWKWFTQNWRGL